MQSHYIKLLSEDYGGRLHLILLPLAPQEIRGIERIQRIGQLLFK